MAAWRSGFDLNEPSAEDEDDPAAFDEHYVAAFNLDEHNAVAFDLDETRSCGDGERETQPDCNDGKRGTRGERRASGERPASGVHPAASEHEARVSAASERMREALRAEQRWRLGNLQSRCGRLMHGNANGWLRMRTSSVNPGRGVLGSKTTLENQDVEYSRNAPV